MCFGFVNYDDCWFECLDEFNIECKGVGKYLVFGFGIYLCIGKMLVWWEMMVGLRVINEWFKNLEFVILEEELSYVLSVVMWGFISLFVFFDI